MKIIGLTGGIASGKSTVANMLIENGYKVIDCDKIAWALAEPQRKSGRYILSVMVSGF